MAGRQDYDGGFRSDGFGAAASDSSFNSNASYSTSSAFDYSGSDGDSGTSYYNSAINRAMYSGPTEAERKEQQRQKELTNARNQLKNRMGPIEGIKISENITIPTTITSLFNALGDVGRKQLSKQLDKEGAEAIFDQRGTFVGVVNDSGLGFKVYSGRKIAGYEGKYAELIADDLRDEGDSGETIVYNQRQGQQISASNKDAAGFNTELPKLPEPSGEMADTDENAKAKREYGQNTQIGTSAQGLLTEARTRRRSLMAGGLIS